MKKRIKIFYKKHKILCLIILDLILEIIGFFVES